MKKLISGFLYVIGSSLFVVSVLVATGKIASADTQSYAQTYIVSQWRNLVSDNSDPTPGATCGNTRLTIGPAEWNITGSVGNTSATCQTGEQCFSETWTATGWDNDGIISDQSTGPKGGTFNLSYENSPTKQTSSRITALCDPASIIGGTGLYGAAYQYDGQTWNSSTNIAGLHSWPIGWSVVGTITN